MKFALYWLIVAAGLSVASYFYQPSIELAVASTLLLLLLSAVVTWSAHKLTSGNKAFLKTLLVAVVAGFMYSQAMDIAYSGFAAPAGLRLDLPFETAAVALLLALIGTLSRLFFLRPQKNEEAEG
jgi:heme/copper-type cytochrome/quinol oxidase subunit 3